MQQSSIARIWGGHGTLHNHIGTSDGNFRQMNARGCSAANLRQAWPLRSFAPVLAMRCDVRLCPRPLPATADVGFGSKVPVAADKRVGAAHEADQSGSIVPIPLAQDAKLEEWTDACSSRVSATVAPFASS